MNVNPCCHHSVSCCSGRTRRKSGVGKQKSFCFFLPLSYSGCRSWGKSRENSCFHIYLLYYGAYPPTIKDVGKVVLPAEGGEESPKPAAPAAVPTRVHDPWWVLVAALCRAVYYFAYHCAGTLGIGCWEGIKKLPDKLLFCCKNDQNKQ